MLHAVRPQAKNSADARLRAGIGLELSSQRKTLRAAQLGQNRTLDKRSRWLEWAASTAQSLWA